MSPDQLQPALIIRISISAWRVLVWQWTKLLKFCMWDAKGDVEAICGVKFIPFGEGNMELHMCENHVPFNFFLLAHQLSWLHNALVCVLI